MAWNGADCLHVARCFCGEIYLLTAYGSRWCIDEVSIGFNLFGNILHHSANLRKAICHNVLNLKRFLDIIVL